VLAMKMTEDKSQALAGSANTVRTVKGSEALILSLLEEGVNQIFGYPGGAIMPVYDSLYDYRDSVDHLLVRHEQGAVHAAQGYARATGKTGVVFVTSGPGATNLITGISDAYIDSTPIVCVTGQVNHDMLGTDAFQEIDVISISSPVTKWNSQISQAEEIQETIAKAFYIAHSGRPGPVLIDITKNAQSDLVDFAYKKCHHIRSYKPVPDLEENQIVDAAHLIDQAKSPLALVGQGVIQGNAEDDLIKFLDKTNIPAACTLLGLSAVPVNYPNYVGMLGMHGNYGPNVLTNEADLLISIGMRFDDRVTGNLRKYGQNAQVIHMDIDPAEINKNVKADVAVLGDVKETLPALTAKVQAKNYPTWLEKFKVREQQELQKLFLNKVKQDGQINMAEVIMALNKKEQDPILVTDVGQHQMAASRYFQYGRTRSNITSGGLGTMGFALPAAIGAQVGSPGIPVVAIIGDGGIQMTVQELATIAQAQLPVKIILLNNAYLGMVRQWQELFFEKRYSFTPISSPDYEKLGESYGIQARRIKHSQDLSDALDEMFHTPGPYLLEVLVEQEYNVFPMVPPGASVSDIILEPPEKKHSSGQGPGRSTS
jgi:acetolactate synthase I/II/III large subunit